ncbi:MAG TPA: hypothetical protein VJ783_13355 [Pirellulales bacterium]|nr:hypothetical protein [Pirellulales bacterium]
MSRLTTVVCALSAIVTIVDYFTAKPLFANWLARQVSHTPDGWQVSPVLNAAAVAAFAGLVWMLTGADLPAGDAHAARRLFRTRIYLIGCGLGLWFFFGPAIVSPPPMVKTAAPSPRPAAQTGGSSGDAIGAPAPNSPYHRGPSIRGRGALDPAHGQSPFAQNPDGNSRRGWRPGDGLRVMADLIEGWVNPLPSEPPRIGR